VLEEERASGGRGTWDKDPSRFVHLLLERSIQKYESARWSKQTVLFDRGIPDCVVYARRLGVDVAPSLEAIDSFRYEPDVLFLAPWPDIYKTDAERIMSFDETVAFSNTLMDVYLRSGYSLIDLPNGSIPVRAAFVRAFITRRTETA
jgi:predicted ATPase